jgi:hypothetical protein
VSKNIITILIIVSIILISCVTNDKINENIITEDDAIEIAINYLKELKYDHHYIIDSAECKSDDVNYMIWFEHKDWGKIKYSRGLIKVDKKTGEPKWQVSK